MTNKEIYLDFFSKRQETKIKHSSWEDLLKLTGDYYVYVERGGVVGVLGSIVDSDLIVGVDGQMQYWPKRETKFINQFPKEKEEVDYSKLDPLE